MIGLISSSKSQRDHPAPARCLYTGNLFELASAYVERACDTWYVLSAKHGLVAPGFPLAPYELSLYDFKAKRRRAWTRGVLESIENRGLNTPDTRWMVLAGEIYRQYLVSELRGEVEVPLDGLNVWRQKEWLEEKLETLKR
jgi:hypothetical protein